MTTADQAIREAMGLFRASPHIDHPNADKDELDARDLLTFALGHEAKEDEDVPAPALARFRRLVGRRERGEPAAYITGRTGFHGLDLEVGRGAFIPRESSEFMADQAIRRLRGRRRPVHVDLATGVGPVALAVASALPEASVFGVDLFARPVAMARRNAQRLGLANARFLRGDLFAPLPRAVRETVDVITVHPPYVGKREVRELPHEILAFEPRESLTDGSPAGMGLLSKVAQRAPGWLRRGGWLLVEVAPDRSRVASAVLRASGFADVRSTKGSMPVSRVVVGRTR